MTLFICFAYDSIYEVNQAIAKCEDWEKPLNDAYKLSKVFDNLLIPHYVDLLIRTSNEYRLSNFMLMQAKFAYI